jgi:hypothetical protein
VSLKILYQNPRRPGEAGVKLVPDQSQRAAEKEILEGLGFTVIEITPASFAQAPRPTGAVSRTKGQKETADDRANAKTPSR